MSFTQTQLWSLSRSLWMSSVPSSVSTTPQSWVLSANLLIPLSIVTNKEISVLAPVPTPEEWIYHCSPLGPGVIDHSSLSVTIQAMPYLLSGPQIKSMCVWIDTYRQPGRAPSPSCNTKSRFISLPNQQHQEAEEHGDTGSLRFSSS